MIQSINYGRKRIEFDLEYLERKTLQINVKPNLSIEVKAPHDAELTKINSKVKKRAGWILKQQNYFRQFQPLQPTRKYIPGETHRYLGRQYRLKVIQSTEEKVVLARGYKCIYRRY